VDAADGSQRHRRDFRISQWPTVPLFTIGIRSSAPRFSMPCNRAGYDH
jgi:hypothetical protein